jgi:Na+/H+-dicarboxylate symporter
MSSGVRVLIALVLGLALGSLVAGTENGAVRTAVNVVGPVGTLWVNAIRMTIIPLVVSLLITSVISAADTKALGRLGGITLLSFILLLTGAALVMLPLAPVVMSFLPSDATFRPPLPPGAVEAAGEIAASGAAPTFATWVTSLLPTNPIAAAATGAMVPLIIFTVLLALASAASSPQARETLVRFFGAVAEAMLVLVRWVIALAPIGVFALMVTLTSQSGFKVAGAIGFYVAAYSVASLGFTLLLYPVVRIVTGIPIRRFARAALPAQLIAFSSSSSIASLPALVEAAEGGLGISKRVSGFVLPLAVSTFKFAGPVSWSIGALFVAWFYRVDVGLQGLVLIGLAAIFLAFAAPGVPRGAFLMLAPLFLSLGLPVEGIGILIAVDAIPDLFATVLNVTGDLAAAAIVGRVEGAATPRKSTG